MERIKQNDKRMKWMAENYGRAYYELFGKLQIEKGKSIQQAIDECWEIFKPEYNEKRTT